MATLPLPVAILDDLISGSANEVIQDGGRKRKGRHFPPPPQWGSKKVPYTTWLGIRGKFTLFHDDVTPYERFRRNWFFVRGIQVGGVGLGVGVGWGFGGGVVVGVITD